MRPSRHPGTPQPLPVTSPYLTGRRVTAHCLTWGADGHVYQLADGTLETRADARLWADRCWSNAQLVVLIQEDKAEEWLPRVVDIRGTDGRWQA